MEDYTKKLNELAELGDEWDGHPKTKAPTNEAIDTARYMTVCPMSYGALSIELHAGGADIEIEISPDGHVESIFFSPFKANK